MEIKNREGQLIHAGDASNRFCDLDLRRAAFEGMILQGAPLKTPNWKVQTFERLICIGAVSSWPISLRPISKGHDFRALT
jgi:hypothetical protein